MAGIPKLFILTDVQLTQLILFFFSKTVPGAMILSMLLPLSTLLISTGFALRSGLLFLEW